MDVALREGDFDAVLAELLPDREHHLALRSPTALDDIGDPEQQREVDRAVAEIQQEALRCRVLDAARVLARRFQDQFARLFDIGAV